MGTILLQNISLRTTPLVHYADLYKYVLRKIVMGKLEKIDIHGYDNRLKATIKRIGKSKKISIIAKNCNLIEKTNRKNIENLVRKIKIYMLLQNCILLRFYTYRWRKMKSL